MRYAVYADLSRSLSKEEREAVFEALDATVPDSGCVGSQGSPNDEVYFCVEADSDDAASEQAARYMNVILQDAGLDAEYTITLQTMNW